MFWKDKRLKLTSIFLEISSPLVSSLFSASLEQTKLEHLGQYSGISSKMIGRSWKEFLSVLERKTADFYVFDCPLSLCLLSPCLLFVPVRTYSFQKHSRTISKNNILLRISKRFNSQSMTNNSVGSPV